MSAGDGRGGRVGLFRRAGALLALIVVLAACGGAVGFEADADRMLRVGSCFIVDAGGQVTPAPCDVRNDGVVTAEVEDLQMCDLLGPDGASAYALVDGRAFCLRDAGS